jgi:hypothetical protein
MSDAEMEKTDSLDVWVSTNEAVERTGYFHTHVRKLARENWNLPEDQRFIRVRRPIDRYEIWLPDLLKYIENTGRGPYTHNRSQNE